MPSANKKRSKGDKLKQVDALRFREVFVEEKFGLVVVQVVARAIFGGVPFGDVFVEERAELGFCFLLELVASCLGGSRAR